jgi:hypothetical protein
VNFEIVAFGVSSFAVYHIAFESSIQPQKLHEFELPSMLLKFPYNHFKTVRTPK